MFTKEEIALAKPCHEAIKTLAERQEKECPTCAGRGKESVIGDYAMRQTSQECKRCNGTGKVKGKWEWEPKMGEWCRFDNISHLIKGVSNNPQIIDLHPGYRQCDQTKYDPPASDVTPLLPWERIEKILEEMGYWLKTERLPFNGCRAMTGNLPKHYQVERWINGRTRQEAVMRAVIELGKENGK